MHPAHGHAVGEPRAWPALGDRSACSPLGWSGWSARPFLHSHGSPGEMPQGERLAQTMPSPRRPTDASGHEPRRRPPGSPGSGADGSRNRGRGPPRATQRDAEALSVGAHHPLGDRSGDKDDCGAVGRLPSTLHSSSSWRAYPHAPGRPCGHLQPPNRETDPQRGVTRPGHPARKCLASVMPDFSDLVMRAPWLPT